MPQLFTKTTKILKNKIQIKWRWCRDQETKKTSTESISSGASSYTTLDWRSLSPDQPPLPFLRESSSPTPSIHTIESIDSTHLISNNTNNSKNISSLDNLDHSSNKPVKKLTTITTTTTTTTTIDDSRNYQTLCPILEESETMMTESSESNMLNNTSKLYSNNSSSIQDEISSESGTSIVDPIHHRSIEKQPIQNHNLSTLSTSSSSSSSSPLPDIRSIQKTPSDKYMSDALVGDEDRCRRKFAKMVLAASKFQSQQEKEQRPSQMALLFDVHGNIDMMRMVRHGKSEYHKFCGNSQYVPPELSINPEYHSELADIWVLGVFLYRMLIGKYPFSAENDQMLFKKMLHGNFSLPNELSDDAKDLLKRMLAPDMSRASLDLIIYHPWLKAYRPSLLDHYYSTASKATSATTTKNESLLPQKRSLPNNTTTPFSTSDTTKKPITNKKSFIGKKLIKRALSFLVQGPFPPPKKPYRDLSHLGTRDSVFARQKL